MRSWLKRTLIGLGTVVVGALAIVGAYAGLKISDYNASVAKVYAVPVPAVTRSTDAAVLARGEHLARSIAACATGDCHGSDLGGGRTLELGPLGTFTGPNITGAGLGAVYSDGELMRLIRHGLRKDGTTLRFMPAHEVNWLPDADVVAMISFLRTMPDVQRANGPMEIGALAKILDRRDELIVDVARRIPHDAIELAGPPTADATYGRFVARICTGCHGERLSGGPIPGAPPSIPIPPNITPHESGLDGWTYDDFDRLLTTGITRDGKTLDPFMPIEAVRQADETEKRALWAYLQTVEPLAEGNR